MREGKQPDLAWFSPLPSPCPQAGQKTLPWLGSIPYTRCMPTSRLVISSGEQNVASRCCHGDFPTIQIALASYMGEGGIPAIHRGCAEKHLIFRTGSVGNANEYLTFGAPSTLASFLLHTFRKCNICLQMLGRLLLLSSPLLQIYPAFHFYE